MYIYIYIQYIYIYSYPALQLPNLLQLFPFFHHPKVPSNFTGRQKCTVDDHVADDSLWGHGVQQCWGLTPMATFGQCCHDVSETGHVWYRTILKPQGVCRLVAISVNLSVIWDWDIIKYHSNIIQFTFSVACWVHQNLSWSGFMMLHVPGWYKYQGFNFAPGHISWSTCSGKFQRFVEEQAWRTLLQKNVSSESPGDPHDQVANWGIILVTHLLGEPETTVDMKVLHFLMQEMVPALFFWEFCEQMSTSRLALGFLNNNRNNRHYSCFDWHCTTTQKETHSVYGLSYGFW